MNVEISHQLSEQEQEEEKEAAVAAIRACDR
jgi:hypothetical protein